MKTLCIYHDDQDGQCAAAILYHHLRTNDLLGVDDYWFEATNYGQPIPKLDELEDGGSLWVLDFSFPIERMKELNSRFNLTWIDHHETAADAAIKACFNPKGIRFVGKAACELTWHFLHPMTEQMPEAVRLVGRFDVQDEQYADAWPFIYGLMARSSHPYERLWSDLLFVSDIRSDLVSTIIKEGRVIERYRDRVFAENMKNAFESTLLGHRILCLNTQDKGSMQFASKAAEDYEMFLAYRKRSDGLWEHSLYQNHPDADCGALAVAVRDHYKLISGGGHRGAAGFVSTRPIDFEYCTEWDTI